MIISASRRTDIPAFYMPWLVCRLREGYAQVRNPMNPRQISQVSLRPTDVEGMVLWSKNPAPLLGRLPDLAGYVYYLQYTLNAYGQDIERFLPPPEARIETFRQLSKLLGPERVRWRYDPVLILGEYDRAWHLHAFARLCSALEGLTSAVTTAAYQRYAKSARALPLAAPPEDFPAMLLEMNTVAARHGITLSVCPGAAAPEGVASARCVDGELLMRLGAPIQKLRKQSGQRGECMCHHSVDIGAYDSCAHGCAYCYANQGAATLARTIARHDVRGPMLIP